MMKLTPRTLTLPYSNTPFRLFAQVAIFLSSLLLAHVFPASPVAAQDAKLIDLAKKESGKIIAYGSSEYNRVEIKPSDAPKSLEDLLSPKYKEKLVMPDPTQHTTTIQWLGSLYKIMGREKADKFVRDLGATKPFLVESFAPSAERVSTGE